MAELDVRIFGGGLEHIALLAEAGGDDDVAAVFRQVNGGLVGGFGFGNVVLNHNLVVGEAKGSLGFLEALDVIGAVALVLVANADVANLDLVGGYALGLRQGHAQNHAQHEQNANELLHNDSILLCVS